ncbi:MAG: L-threonylcarbamoyladenylate synthase [Alphaproteobacteria bacterium]|nr:L-threonylcarbamoyladenylate synthase [Alphaproteobacteria bacterium]
MFKNDHIQAPTPQALAQAADFIQRGKLVAFPTETVYGLGADATNDQAVAMIYAAKGRPQFNPLIIHVAEPTDLDDIVIRNDTAELLTSIFWPGPLTLVLPRASNSTISLLASAGLETLAVRCPNHPVAQKLIQLSGRPIAAPSANASGGLSPTEASHVADSLGDKVDLVLDGGHTRIGVESTVLDLTGRIPTILRHGGVTLEDLTALLGEVHCSLVEDESPKSPGMITSHYAPRLPVRLDAMTASPNEAFLTFGEDRLASGGATRMNLSATSDLIEAAANLFSMLRALDQSQFSGIAVMPIPEKGLGAAINDRLHRAAAPRIPA